MRLRAAVLFLVLGAVPAMGAPSFMIGTWFGHGQPDDKGAMYIDRMRPNGSWRGEYRTCIKGRPSNQIQEGRWSLMGDVVTLQVETVNGQFAPRTDYYKMLSHDAKSQKYVSEGWNFTYTPQRVADNFQMPDCDLIS